MFSDLAEVYNRNSVNEKLYNIALTPFGVEFDNFKNIRYKNNSNEIIIGTIKGLEQVYGIDILIKAFSVLVGKFEQQNSTKKVFLEIVGKGSKEDELKALVRELNLENKVIFSGRIEHKYVPDKLATFDIFVALSRVESFGVAVVEAHAARRPVVVSDVGGLNEIVEHRVDGMKSYAGNPNSLADSILELLLNPELCDKVTKQAKIKVKNEFNWAKIAQDTYFTYEKAICQTMAERQAKQILQERAKKAKKAKGTENEITNLLSFKQRQAFA